MLCIAFFATKNIALISAFSKQKQLLREVWTSAAVLNWADGDRRQGEESSVCQEKKQVSPFRESGLLGSFYIVY